MRRSCTTSCFEVSAPYMTEKHRVAHFTSCNKPGARSLFNLEENLQLDHCAFSKLVLEQKQDDFFSQISVLRIQDGCRHLRKVLVLTHHQEVFDIYVDELVIRSKHQFLDSLMELVNWIRDVLFQG